MNDLDRSGTPGRIYWGDTHHNLFVSDRENVDLDRVCRAARAHLDFMTFAYYTPRLFLYKPERNPPGKHGFRLETWKATDRVEREWRQIQDATRVHNEDGAFVAFPGYEWQGNSSSGDHNVVYREEGSPIYRVDTLAELYECLRRHAAIAIPHHTAYRPGMRGKDWSVHDDALTPFSEVFSVHGCSETDEAWVGMWRNHHMAPNLTPGTYEAALLRGLHVGAICSTDAFGQNMLTGTYNLGLMAVMAPELTRESLWTAFHARRVYGVTGDRIELDFSVDGHPMGACIPASVRRRIRVVARGLDAIDRIELLRGPRVVATHNHQSTWDWPRRGTRSRFCLRVEAGWGPTPDELDTGEHTWEGTLSLSGGRFLRSVPCWCTCGQGPVRLSAQTAAFALRTAPGGIAGPWQNANVFVFEADPADRLCLRLNGLTESGPVADFMAGSRVMWYRDECVEMLRNLYGLTPQECERDDAYYHEAYKAKIHRVMPEAACTATLDFEDDTPVERETFYRVRVEQRNGQRAWSSPVWVKPCAGG